VEDDVACCDVEAAVVICSPTCSCRRALLVKKFSERRNMSVFCVLVFVGGLICVSGFKNGCYFCARECVYVQGQYLAAC